MTSLAEPAARSESSAARRERLRLLVRSPSFIVGAAVILFWITCAVLGDHITPYDPRFDQTPEIGAAPSWQHLFGTDRLGRDVFSRVLAGSRDILLIAPLATLLATLVGTTLGLITGYFKGIADDTISRVVDALLAIPLILLAVTVVAALGSRSTWTVIIVIAAVFSPIIARTVRAAVLGEADLDYVEAARLRGERSPYVMFSEVLPNVMPPILVEATIRLGYAIFAVATLSFIGFGLQPPSPDWAVQIADNYQDLAFEWWSVLFPALAIASLVVAVNLVSDSVQQVLELMTELALELRDLDVAYRVRGIDRPVLRGVTLEIAPGESYGLVGESGCGKSTAALAVVRYLARNGRVTGGSISVAGQDVLGMGGGALRAYRARTVSMVYQNPGAALNPSIRVGKQVAEAFAVLGASQGDARARASQALAKVHIADPDSVMSRYPHQLSGGMQQRVVIAMALAKNPALLVLDEPTTGLDATVEAEVLDLVSQLQAELHTSVLFISHNLGVISKMCSRVGVLYAGRLVEEGPVETVLRDPRHPYTVGLLRCIPRGGVRKDHGRLDTIPGFLPALGVELTGCVFADRCAFADTRCREEEPPPIAVGADHESRCWYHERAPELPREDASDLDLPPVDRDAAALVQLHALTKVFKQRGHEVHALTEVSAAIWPGETLGLVGESGSGKTTLARTLLGIVAPTSGTALLESHELPPRYQKRSREELRALQIVFQNPDSALNRRHWVRRILLRSMKKLAGVAGAEADARIRDLCHRVRLTERTLTQKPAQLSGGLKQRVAIARAFAGDPKLVVCDEPTSALDVSVQAAILNLLVELQAEKRVAYLFISHDLGVVRYISDRIAVLYLGRVQELGPADVVFDGPHHPYTEALLSAVPTVDGGGRGRIRLEGDIPSAASPPSGCVFHTRCPRKVGEICETTEPPLAEAEDGHHLRCHIPIEELRRLQGKERATA